MIVFAFLFPLFVGLVLWNLLQRRDAHLKFVHLGIPGPQPHYIYGNFRQLRRSVKLPHEVMGDWLKKYGDVFGYYMGSKPILVIKDLNLVNEVLVKQFNKFANRQQFVINVEPVVSTLIGLRNQRWKDVRSILSPTFSTIKIRYMSGFMSSASSTMHNILKQKNGAPVDVYDLFQGLSLDVICRCALALQSNPQENPNDTFKISVRTFLGNVVNPIVDLAIYFPVVSHLMSLLNKLSISGKMTELIISNLKKVIRERRKAGSSNSVDILQLMLDSNAPQDDKMAVAKRMTDREVIANAWVFMLAGYETTTNGLTYIAWMLAKHQDIQEKVYQEILREVKENAAFEELGNLQYLDCVINETLRIYPPVSLFVQRECSTDTQLGQHVIPAGLSILIPVWQIHRDPSQWPDPEKFDPNRFLPEAKAKRHPMAFIPFGAGPRNCIGKRFALLEMKQTFAKLIRHFKIETCEKSGKSLQFTVPTVTVNPKDSVWLTLVPREAK